MLALGIAAAVPAYPLELFTVSGECQVMGQGLLHVFLVDERGFSVPMSGIQAVTTTLDASGPKTRRVAFAFTVPRGTYGIRCFLDVNGNGGLDRGLACALGAPCCSAVAGTRHFGEKPDSHGT